MYVHTWPRKVLQRMPSVGLRSTFVFKYHCLITAPHCGCQISNSNPRLLTLLFKLLSKSDNACYCLYPLMVLPSVTRSIPWRPDGVKATLSFVTISDEMLCTVICTERVFVWVTSPDSSKVASSGGRCGQTQSFRPGGPCSPFSSLGGPCSPFSSLGGPCSPLSLAASRNRTRPTVLTSGGSDTQNWYHDNGHITRNNAITSTNQRRRLIKTNLQ